MAGKKGMRHYSLELRQEVVRKHQEKGVANAQLSDEYGIDKTD